jgi:hypothetical protein
MFALLLTWVQNEEQRVSGRIFDLAVYRQTCGSERAASVSNL